MHTIGEEFAPAAIPIEQLKQLVVKLRWIGLDEEAEHVGSLHHVAPKETTPIGPLDTDRWLPGPDSNQRPSG